MSPSKVTAASITFTIVTTAAVLSNPITRHAHAFSVSPAQPLTHHHHHHHHALQQQRLFYHPSRLHYPVSSSRKTFLHRGPYWRGGDAFFQMTATASDEDLEKEISSMKVSQIRQELESYGISTKSFFEKSELVEALVTARKEGKIPVVGGGNASAAPSSSSTSPSSSSSSSPSDTSNRQERIQQEIDKCNKLKIGELKKELESYGVSTKSYFEKSEFVRAVAEARVDGPPKTRETSSSSSSSSSGGSRASGRVRDEPRDPSYRDVIVTKYPGNKSLLEGKIIEVRSR